MSYEAGGYPTTLEGVDPETWRLAGIAGRRFEEVNSTTKKRSEYVFTESIAALESQVGLTETALSAARDPDVSLSSSNPHQYIGPGIGNTVERNLIRQSANTASKKLASRRAFIYQFALRRHYELKYSGIASDAFERIRERVDSLIGKVVPESIQKVSAIQENLNSENPEDWSNAVHSCRRLLQDLADALFPATEAIRTVNSDGKTKVKLGKEQYINRLMTFIEDRSSSTRFVDIVGSHLRFIGDRLDSVFAAAQKGSHNTVLKNEADRYVVYTYLIVGDILSLDKQASVSAAGVLRLPRGS